MTMNHKQEQVVVEWPGLGAWPRSDAASAPRPSGKAPRLKEPGREAVFDIADFEAIAIFAGLPPRQRRQG
jgi:hypothetical protein